MKEGNQIRLTTSRNQYTLTDKDIQDIFKGFREYLTGKKPIRKTPDNSQIIKDSHRGIINF